MIETPRLILRRWREADRAPLAAMLTDPEVMDWLGGIAAPPRAYARLDHFNAEFDKQGFGHWAIERSGDSALLGYAGLAPIDEAMPVSGVEIGWALVRSTWGSGYAAEAARAAALDGFERLRLDEIIAFTAETNLRSQAVMGRIGFARDPARDFDHPNLAEGDPLRRHWVYAAKRR